LTSHSIFYTECEKSDEKFKEKKTIKISPSFYGFPKKNIQQWIFIDFSIPYSYPLEDSKSINKKTF
jgi:hypothetical protein